MARFAYLPAEVLEEIMLWLPPESLRRFKLVQKSWYLQINALMSDPVFVAKHLCNMRRQVSSAPSYHFSYLMTVEVETESEDPVDEEQLQPRNEEREQEEEIEVEIEENGYESEIEDEDEEPEHGSYLLVLANDDHSGRDYIPLDTDPFGYLIFFLQNYYFTVECQCDGIICLSVESRWTVCLLNPALREMKVIRCTCYGSNGNCLLGVGFGHDSSSNEYKLVTITAITMNEDEDGDEDEDEDEDAVADIQAEVYSLRTNSWRKIEFDIEMPFIPHEEVYCEGVCYWYCKSWTMRMVSFDFSDEVFREVRMPVGTRPSEDWDGFTERAKLSVWKESVVLFMILVGDPMVMDMWVLDSQCGGVKGSYSWTKHVTIGPLEGIKRPLGFWNDAELILEAGDGGMKLYNLGSEVASHLSNPLEWFSEFRFVIYQKSLVSVLRKDGRRSVVQV